MSMFVDIKATTQVIFYTYIYLLYSTHQLVVEVEGSPPHSCNHSPPHSLEPQREPHWGHTTLYWFHSPLKLGQTI